ncbi:hypothetical protein ECANGB1_536 [Enterospora canceri]|uniref:Uncharacterized protein n=1 Tax=Enterospora canceri TaxID=1081671 RepID=A0A1Y1S7X4_9MICR|nr:hypothetical protein ECANGB1_536 [Enterospora canceri]
MNKSKKIEDKGSKKSHLEASLMKMFIFGVALFILQMLELGFIFNGLALIFDVLTTYLHYVLYRDDPKKPNELFLAWILGDFIKIYFNIFVYRSPLLYTCAILSQLVFDVLTVLSAPTPKIDVSYLEY